MLLPIKDYNPTKRTAYITIVLICINTAVFIFQYILSDKPFGYNIGRYSMVPYEVTHFENVPTPVLIEGQENKWRVLLNEGMDIKKGPVRVEINGQIRLAVLIERKISPFVSLLTSIFMHGSLWHLLGNMLFLWIFGNNIEDYLGKMRFIFFYLACGAGASLIHVLFNFDSTIPVIGASGAVSGVMGAYLVLYPHAKVRTLVFLFIIITFIDVPASVFLIVWFIFQFFSAGGGSGIAWLAHVGGFLLGVLLIKMMQRRPRIRIRPQGPDDDFIDVDILQ